MAKTAPSPIDVLDFQFKLQCRLKIFENDTHDTFKKSCSLVTAASRYGLLFVGTSSPKFQVIEVENIQNYTIKEGDIPNYKRRTISLPSIPKYLNVNCNSTKLCVVVEKHGCVKAVIYDVLSFLKQNISVLQKIRLSTTPGVNVTDLSWNPTVPTMLVACKDDGTLGLYDVKDDGLEIKELPKTAAATCLCWSPKGKQLVVGSTNGKLTQYKLDLQVAKVINPPPINGNPYPISLQWISNYQFVAVYTSGGDETQMSLIVVDAPKNADPSYTNYDDVCYSYGNARPHQFYMLQQPLWNILIVASSNSMDVSVMHLEKDIWTQWILMDSARAELPLSAIKQDTLPVGMTLDTSSSKPIPWGEKELPPAPYLFLLSHQGVLCCFHTLNLKDDAPNVCTPPEVLVDRSGAVNFTVGESDSKPVQASSVTNVVKPTPVVQTTAQSQPLPPFGMNITKPQTTVLPTPTFATPPKIQTSTTSFFNKPSLFAPQSQSLPKTEAQPLVVTKPQVEIKKPETTSENNSQKLIVSKPVPPPHQGKEIVATELKAPPPQKTAISGIPAINEETEKLRVQMMKEECATLDMEIKVLLAQGNSMKVDLGSDSEATNIVEVATVLQDFLKEMDEISTTQAAEIHCLKQNLIQTWVWYEEARTRFATYKDPSLKSLLLAQPLDAASERKLDEIRHLIYYLESQLVQANAALDDQWEIFQDSCKKKLSYKVPSIEWIYQVMVKQNATLQKQVYVLKDISMRIRSKLKNINGPRLLVSLDRAGELEEQLKTLHMEPKDLIQIRYEKVFRRQKKLSKGTVDKLKESFQNVNVSHITVKKPQNNTLMQMSGLGVVPFSPIAPKKKEGRLDFVQSTPIAEVTKAKSAVTESNPPQSVVVNLFKQEAKSVGGDVKTSAFVPMVNTKSNLFGSGSLDQNTLFNQKPQKPVIENVSKPPMFNLAPPNTTLPPQKTPSFFGSIPTFDTSKISGNESGIKQPVGLIKPPSNDNQPTKTNTFSPFSVASTQNFTFLTSKSDSNIPSGVFMDKVQSKPESESKLSFMSPFGQAVKNDDVANNINVNFGDNQTKPAMAFGDRNLFGQNTISSTSENKLCTVDKDNSEIKSTASPNVTSAQNIPTAVTTTVSLGNQVFTCNAPSEIIKSVGQTPILTASSGFGFQSTFTTTSSNLLFGSKVSIPTTSVSITSSTSATSLNNQQTPITAVQKTVVVTTVTQIASGVSAKPLTNVNDKITVGSTQSTLTASPLFGQLTTSAAAFGNATTTTSIFANPILTTKSAGTLITVPSVGTKTTTISVGNTTTTQTTTSTTSTPTISTTSTTTLFGTTITPTSTAVTSTTSAQPSSQLPSLFAKTQSTLGQSTSTTTAVFGQTSSVLSSPVSSTPSIFGGTSKQFGQSLMTPAIFGSPVTSSTSANVPEQLTTSSNTFGQQTTSSSIFGKASPAPTSFGQTVSTPFTLGQSAASNTFGTSTIPSSSAPSALGQTTIAFGQTTTTPSLFGQTTVGVTSAPSVFSQSTTTSTAPISLFGQTTSPQVSTSSVFGQTTSAPSVFAQTTSTPSVFGQTTSPQVSAGTVFGQTTSAPSMFAQTTSTPSVFGQTTSPQVSTGTVFGQTTSAPSVFAQTTSTPSVFGQTTSIPSMFGATPNVFAQATSTPSVFGQTSTPSVFGSSIVTQTSAPSVFGQTAPTQSVFGQPTSSSSIFGQPVSTSSVFGQQTSASSAFGQPSPPVFGQATSSAPVFGQQQSEFGQSTSIFRQPSTTGSIFGQSTTTSSVFGQTPFGNNSIFKNSTNNVFGGSSAFGQTATTTSTFGSSSPFSSSSVFGGATNNLFGKPSFGTTDNLNFGALNTGSTPATTTATTNVFGSSFNSFRKTDKDQSFNTSGNIFATPATTSSSTVFGSSPFSKATPAFGGPATFGSSPTFPQPSGFGSSFTSNSTFGTSNQPGPFSGSGNSQTVNQSGFGSSTAFQKPAFAAQPSFGAQPSGFGAPPTFGATAFGSSNFGSPNRVFGNAEGFGATPQQQSSTFANLANQPTIGFGSVAQQAPVENIQQPSFTGGSSFTSWR